VRPRGWPKPGFQMMGVFAEFERSMIQERVRAGLARAVAEGTKLGGPKIDKATEAAICSALQAGDAGMHKIAAAFGVGTGTAHQSRYAGARAVADMAISERAPAWAVQRAPMRGRLGRAGRSIGGVAVRRGSYKPSRRIRTQRCSGTERGTEPWAATIARTVGRAAAAGSLFRNGWTWLAPRRGLMACVVRFGRTKGWPTTHQRR